MKRLTIILFIACLIMPLWAGGGIEEEEKEAEIITIKVLSGGDSVTPGGYSVHEAAEMMLRKTYPNVEVNLISENQADGSTISMDSMINTGDTPNIYHGYMGRIAKYLDPDFLVDLSLYIDDLDDYIPGAVIYLKGKALAVSGPGGSQALCINLDILKSINYPLPDFNNWTIEDFLDLCEAVQSRAPAGVWPTWGFAANQSGDYLMRNWGASFGATFYEDGDYTQTSFDGPEALATMRFFKVLKDKGYIRSDSIALNDDDYAAEWAAGKIAVAPWFYGWSPYYLKTAITQGIIDEPFEWTMVPYPRAPGVDRAPVYISTAGFIVIDNKDDMVNEISAKLVQWLNSPEMQLLLMYKDNNYPNRISLIKDAQWTAAKAVMEQHGTYDMGLATATYSETRPLFPEALQRIWTGQEPTEVVGWYKSEMDKILAQNK